MTLNNRRGTRAALWFAASIGFAGGALAEDQSATAVGQLEEVVVTATKRSSTVQETPMSITAITAQDIQERGLSDSIWTIRR